MDRETDARLQHYEGTIQSKISVTRGSHPGTWSPISGASTTTDEMCHSNQGANPDQDTIPYARPTQRATVKWQDPKSMADRVTTNPDTHIQEGCQREQRPVVYVPLSRSRCENCFIKGSKWKKIHLHGANSHAKLRKIYQILFQENEFFLILRNDSMK
jgi:hypothetical protein